MRGRLVGRECVALPADRIVWLDTKSCEVLAYSPTRSDGIALDTFGGSLKTMIF